MSLTKTFTIFLLITFVWTWAFWLPSAFAANGWAIPSGLESFLATPFNPAAWGPLIGALAVTVMNDGVKGVWPFLRRGLKFGFGWCWYLAIFAIFPVLIGGSLLIAALLGEPVPELEALANPAVLPIAFLYILFLGGPLQEEFGWRGLLLDQLQEKLNALLSSVIVGLIWGIWHLPLFFMPARAFYYERPIWGLILSTVLISVFFTWIFNNTGKSIAAMLLLHTMYNFSHFIFPTLESDLAAAILFGLQFIAVIAVVAMWGPKRLARDS